jgi:hypothetical protein
MALQHDDKLKNMTKNNALFIGAIINFIIGIGHLACMVWHVLTGCLRFMALLIL